MDLDVASRAYREALTRVDETREAAKDARTSVREAAEALTRARSDLNAAIVESYQTGLRQHQIVAVTGLSRERVRQILRAAGIEADD